MDELDPQVAAAIERVTRAAKDAKDPRLTAAAAMFAALARRDAMEREAWQIVRDVANEWHEYHPGWMPITNRARELLGLGEFPEKEKF